MDLNLNINLNLKPELERSRRSGAASILDLFEIVTVVHSTLYLRCTILCEILPTTTMWEMDVRGNDGGVVSRQKAVSCTSKRRVCEWYCATSD